MDSGECESGRLKPTHTKRMALKMPEGIENGYGGVFNINYSVAFPDFGLYQIELYYRKNDEQEEVFAGAVPLTVCEKRTNQYQ
jgi:hypothetical protein